MKFASVRPGTIFSTFATYILSYLATNRQGRFKMNGTTAYPYGQGLSGGDDIFYDYSKFSLLELSKTAWVPTI